MRAKSLNISRQATLLSKHLFHQSILLQPILGVMLTQQQQKIIKGRIFVNVGLLPYHEISHYFTSNVYAGHWLTSLETRLSTRLCQLKEGRKNMLQCINLGHSSSSPTCKTSAYGLNNILTYEKQLIKHEETNQWPATLNNPEDISVPGHSPIINSVIFKYWSKYHAYTMVSAKKLQKFV